MTIIDKIIPVNPYSNPDKALKEVKAVVMHWTAVPMQPAIDVCNYYANRKYGKAGYGSAHFIVGLNHDVFRCIHTNRVAYHCGVGSFDDAHKDPSSGKFYTDMARTLFGEYAENYQLLSPNLCTLGIEMVPVDKDGKFNESTLADAAELVASLLTTYKLDVDKIITHNQVVGYKNCPKFWVDNPDKLEAFRKVVKKLL